MATRFCGMPSPRRTAARDWAERALRRSAAFANNAAAWAVARDASAGEIHRRARLRAIVIIGGRSMLGGSGAVGRDAVAVGVKHAQTEAALPRYRRHSYQ